MKKFILFVALPFLAIPAFSQVSIGITGGYTLARFHYGNSDNMTNSFNSEWHAGLIAETKLTHNFYLQPQLLVSRQGGKSEYEKSDAAYYYSSIVAHTTYLELPVNVVYKFRRWYGGAGPYVARGLGGRFHAKSIYAIPATYIEESWVEGKVEFNSKGTGERMDKWYMRNMDYGLNFVGGYALTNKLFFNVNYHLGLTQIYGSGSKVRNRYWGVSVGYFLKKGK